MKTKKQPEKTKQKKRVGKGVPDPNAQFKPGQSGNPNGRPKGSKNRSTIARKVLEMIGIMPDEALKSLKRMFPSIEGKMTVEEIMTIRIASQAMTKGDVRAYEAIMDSAHGKASQSITGKDGGALEFEDISKNISEAQLKAVLTATLAGKEKKQKDE